jgi:hydroxymethylpyrimidine/phosphomethylpyrimidine kinase
LENDPAFDRLTGMFPAPPVVLSIAGFDPTSGAGMTADIKTIAAHDCYGVTCITALTVQSTAGVKRVDPVAPDLVQAMLEELIADVPIAAVHVGMLATEGVVRVVSGFLVRHKLAHIVLDPVLRSSSGAGLLELAGVRLVVEKLLPLAEVITPNIDEAAALTGMAVTNLGEMKAAAGRLHELGAKAVVITGGHLDPAADLLSFSGPKGWEEHVFQSERLNSNSTHGTGCAFSTALACNLARGCPLPEAVSSAKAYVTAAIANAYPLGRGIGPVNHMYKRKDPE